MVVSAKQVGQMIEQMAPLRYQCDWDKSGFHVQLNQSDVTGILVCLDVTPQVIEEAKQKQCNFILAHHPLLFRPVSCIDNASYEGRCAAALMESGISLYCAHTSMDAAGQGINVFLAQKLGIAHWDWLTPTAHKKYCEVSVYVPHTHANSVRLAMHDGGAGRMGNYSCCSFSIEGEGRFKPEEGAEPFIGKQGEVERVDEVCVTSICEQRKLPEVLTLMRTMHPYEEPAIHVTPMEHPSEVEAGLGVIGCFEQPKQMRVLLDEIKAALETDAVRFCGDLDDEIQTVALCGGGGSDLIELARSKGAQVFLTGEIKHNFYVAAEGMALVEAGHYDTEKCFCELTVKGLQTMANELNYKLSIYATEKEKRAYINY